MPYNVDISQEVKDHIQFIMEGKPREVIDVNGAHFFVHGSDQRNLTEEDQQILAEEGFRCQHVSQYAQVLVNGLLCRSTQ